MNKERTVFSYKAILVQYSLLNMQEKIIAKKIRLQLPKQVETEMRNAGLGYHFPLLFGSDTKKIWDLRKAGLGLLSNLPGDEKAVPVIEDTAVDVNDLARFYYMREFNIISKK